MSIGSLNVVMMFRVLCSIMLVLMVAGLAGCRTAEPPPVLPQTAEVTYLGSFDQGTLSVRAIGYGKRVDEAVRAAEETAFWTLLFRGIPGSNQAQALVADMTEQQAEQTSYFQAFFTEGRYQTFMVESALAEASDRVKKTGRAVVEVTINLHALRRDLERNGVIRRFGFQ